MKSIRKRLSVFALIFAVCFALSFAAKAKEKTVYNLTDPATDLRYSIAFESNRVSVSLGNTELGTTYLDEPVACSVYGSILSLYTVDNLNSIVTLYGFDFYNDTIDSLAISAKAFVNDKCFATDGNGNAYFVSEGNSGILCVYKPDNDCVVKTDLGSPIKQLLCIDLDSVIALTNDNAYICQKESCTVVPNYYLSAPISYIGENTVKDMDGNEYIYSGNTLSSKVQNTAEALTEPNTGINEKYFESIYYVGKGTTLSSIKKAFAELEIISTVKADGTAVKSGKVGTGTTLTFANGKTTTVVIYGELTGEGNINSRDLKAILNHLSGKEALEGFFTAAADINRDGKINTKDALLLAKMF